ncbi:MAG: thermonuclease family protein [Rhizobiaceae bacterium]|nr:thermonuclease family protein [Rhizobiaceae bacterium]
MRFLSFRKPRFRRRGRRRRTGRLTGWIAVIALFGVCALLAAWLEELGRVELIGSPRIHDGDTLTLQGERIRLMGIDAFEYDQTCEASGRRYACGREARAHLTRLAELPGVKCEGSRRDRYDRLLAVCMAGGTDLNREMVSSGWAVAYGNYHSVEASARARKQGAWRGEFVYPQEWRATNGQARENEHDFLGWLLEKIGGFLL